MYVLVVEDNPERAARIEALLQVSAGDELACATAGLDDAIELLLAQPADCVVLALDLGGPDGMGPLERIRSAAVDVPVLVLSDDDSDDAAVAALRAGAQDVLVEDDLDGRALRRAVRHAVERKRFERRLTHKALHDELTGLPNRALLTDRLRLSLSRLDRTETCLAVMLLDIDDFKAVNDEQGHDVGDRVLRDVARSLSRGLRGGDTAARLGGDEFVLLCEDVAGGPGARAIGMRVLGRLPVRGSLGIALTSDRDTDPADLLREADAAMYRAKRRGGNDLEIAGGDGL